MTATLPTGVLRAPRAGLARALRQRVAGDRFAEAHAKIWDAEGPRWFTEADPIWRVHLDTATFVGGIRALLLQSLHPVAMQGVAENSGFRHDPWGRLQRTSSYLATTTFGTVAAAQQIIAVVKAVHVHVTGTTPQGRVYHASDPDLLLWIHAAEADSFLTAHQQYGADRLTAAEQDTYVAQLGSIAAQLGVIDPPQTVAELDAVIADFRPELRWSAYAMEAAELLLRKPALPGVARPGYAMLAAGAIASLPPWARAELRLPTLPITDRLLARPAARVALGTIRWALSG
ncbi:MAG: oxygenase MpaB family protein [Propionibacteriaceae bacterium]